jgi:multidrug efflux system membrane fusion protein
VEAGELLFEIDPRPFKIAVDNARAQVDKTGQSVSGQIDDVASAEATVARAEASLRLAEVQYRRIQPLAKRGALPLQDRDKAQAQLDSARSGLRKAESELKKTKDQLGSLGADNADTRVAIAQLENAQLQLSYTKVVAPVNGFVTQLELTIGSCARAGDALLSFVDRESWRIVAYMRESKLQGVEVGQPVRVYLPAYPDIRWKGVVQGIGWGIEQQDGALGADGLPSIEPTVDWVRLAQRFPVRISLVDPDPAYPLRKGMSATVRIDK